MARQAGRQPEHGCTGPWLAGRRPSHTVPGISPRPLDARCHPCPGTLRCRREYRSAGGRRGGQMIARTWRGWAPLATADDYQRHYELRSAGTCAQSAAFAVPACCARTMARKSCLPRSRSSPAWTPSAALPETILNWPSSRKPRGMRRAETVGLPSPGCARHFGMSRPPGRTRSHDGATLSRTHGHGSRRTGGAEWVLVRSLRRPAPGTRTRHLTSQP